MVATLTCVALLVGAYFLLRGTISRPALSHSVAATIGPGYYGSCRAGTDRAWTCRLMTSDASDAGIRYALTISGRCWHGSRVATGGINGLPLRVSGCVGVFDQLRARDRLGLDAGWRQPGFY